MNAFAKIIAAALFAVTSVCASAQIAPASTEVTSTATITASAADNLQTAVKKWTDREKFTVIWSLQGNRDQSWTALPKEGKFKFNSSDYCEGMPANAKFSTEGGKFVILITRTRPGCGVTKLSFDLTTSEGILETLTNGQFSQLPGRIVRLKD